MNYPEEQPGEQQSPVNSTIMIYWAGAIVAAILIAFSSMMMALGTGLASSPDEPVARTSQVLWGLSGISFIPIVVLLLLTTATRKRIFGYFLGLTVIAAGVLAAVGWFVDAGEMPGNTIGNAIVIAVVLVPVTIGVVLIQQADSLGMAAKQA